MEVVSRLPAPKDPAALDRLLEAQKILCSSCVSEEDCQQAVILLQELGNPLDEGGFDYFPALLTLASLSATGFEPAIEQDRQKAASLYLQFLAHERSSELAADLLEEAATALCNIVREEKSGLGVAEQRRLEELGNGAGAGVVTSVATWARFSAHELDRQIREASEDPKDREKRLAREAAREAYRSEELVRQRGRCEDALARAEELQLEGNDLCRQGQLPGNAKGSALLAQAFELYGAAVSVLSECLNSGLHLVPEEANNVRRRRGTIQSNTAQVCISLRDWKEAQRQAQAAVEDDPENSKSWFRRARAEIELRDWNSAAQTVDEALKNSRGRKGDDADANMLELWKLAEEVSKALPDFKWSSSKPLPKKGSEDFELRLHGFWEYQGGKFEIKLTKFGALVFEEESVKIDLMKKSKLTWRGDFEMVPGMVLVVSYEPGCDMVKTEFIPPEDCPADQKWKGPTKFTAKRCAAPPKEPEPAEEPVVAAPTPQLPLAPKVPLKIGQTVERRDRGEPWGVGLVTSLKPLQVTGIPSDWPNGYEWHEVRLATTQVDPEPPAPSVPDDAPRILWLSGHDGISGCYELVPEMLQNDRPVYRRIEGLAGALPVPSDDCFLWYRGGNWSVTKTLHASPLAAPFLARCGDASGRSRHPLDVRRPRWFVRRGRGQEDSDPAIRLSAAHPSSADAAGYPPTASRASLPITAGGGSLEAAQPVEETDDTAAAKAGESGLSSEECTMEEMD